MVKQVLEGWRTWLWVSCLNFGFTPNQVPSQGHSSALQTRGLQHLPKGERQKLLKLLLEVCGLRWLLPEKLD